MKPKSTTKICGEVNQILAGNTQDLANGFPTLTW
jgi:hypothetical protein